MQLTLSSLLLVIIPTLAIAQRPPACQPNFQGSVVKAVNPASGKVWSVASNADVGSPVTAGSSAAPLLFSFDGSVNNNYIIKLYGAAANNLVIGQDSHRILKLAPVQGTNNPTFRLLCNGCLAPGSAISSGTVVGSDCYIADPQDTAFVQILPGNNYLQFRAPNYEPNQAWNLVAV